MVEVEGLGLKEVLATFLFRMSAGLECRNVPKPNVEKKSIPPLKPNLSNTTP